MGWILVMFDLPTLTAGERKTASQFRKCLLDDGYQMMQYSVYMRACVDYERMKKHIKRVEQFAPSGGNVRVIFITDRQWEKSINIIGKEYGLIHRGQNPEMQAVFEFW